MMKSKFKTIYSTIIKIISILIIGSIALYLGVLSVDQENNIYLGIAVLFTIKFAYDICFFTLPKVKQKNEKYFEYNKYSNTIRQMPQNYKVAINHQGYWIADYDISADPDLIHILVDILFDFKFRWESTGDDIVKKLNEVKDNK